MRKPSLSSSSSSSSKQAHVSRINNKVIKQEPRLSGAYIRSLVKHLTTSVKSKDHCNNKFPETLNLSMQPQPQPQPQPQHKKQVRKRQHTNKPYQERLLNMAEARREIVTALKFHRASMKQRQTTTANNHRQPDQSLSSVTSNNSYLQHYSTSTSQTVPHFLPISLNTPPPLPNFAHENLDFTLPVQTLGLNLNFQDFKNLDGNCFHNSLSIYSPSSSASSSSSSSSSAAVSLTTIEETAAIPEVAVVANTTTASSATTTSPSAVVSLTTTEETAAMPGEVVAEEVVMVSNTTTSSGTTTSSSSIYDGLHHAMDEEGMEEIRSIGEQHQMEWDDRVNMLTSARWFEFLKIFEMEQEDWKLDQVMEFPDRMDIGEIEEINGEWLA